MGKGANIFVNMHFEGGVQLAGKRASGMPPLLLFAVGLSQIVVAIDYLAMSVALPVMARELQVSTTELQWALSAYLLSFASFMIVGGRLGDIYGRRRGLMTGITLFAFASVLGGISSSVGMLIAARVLQGVGAAFFFPTSFSILTNALRPALRQAATGIVVGIANLGIAIGPFVGGILTETLGWRWVFFFNAPIALIAILLAITEMRETRDESAPRSIDFPGLVTIVLGCSAVALVIDYGADWGWTSALTLGTAAAGVIMFVAFRQIEHRVRNPLLQLDLFKGRAFTGITVIGGTANFLFPMVVFAFTLFFENVLHMSAFLAGAALLPMSAGTAISGPIAGRLDVRFGPRVAMGTGLIPSTASFAALAMNTSVASWILLLFVLGVAGFGVGLAYATTNASALAVVPPQKSGAASGIVLTGLALSAAFGVTITSELIETFASAGTPNVTAHSIGSSLGVGAIIAGVTFLIACVLLPSRAASRAAASRK
jgi:EmrB/QacA subfamily drug resistance transporter